MWTVRRLSLAVICVGGVALGPASAEGIDIGGTLQMGLVGTSTSTGAHRTQLMQDLDLTLRMSRTTDGGFTFGIELDLDDLLDEADTPHHPGRRPVEN